MRDQEKVRAARRRWYRRNAEHAKAKVNERRRALYKWFREYKSGLACQLCEENHPACLVFHHRDPSEKEITINAALRNGWGKERILKEIAKCDVLCANCHRKLHWAE